MEIQYISCVRFSLQLILSESVFLLWQPRRERFPLRLAGSLLGYLVGSGLWFLIIRTFHWEIPAVRIFFYLGLFLLTLACIGISFDLRPIEILFIGTGGYATEHIAYSLAKIVQYLTGAYAEQIGPVWENLLFRFLPYLLVALLTYLFLVRYNRKAGAFKDYDVRLTLLALGILVVAVIISVYYSNADYAPQRVPVTEIICPLYGTICCMLSLVLEYYILRENRYQMERDMMEQSLQMANTQRAYSKEAIDIINMKCHDLKHQIRALAAMDDAGQRREYVDEVQRAVSIYDATYHTGCEALDYVLQEKALLCGERAVEFSCMADGEAISFMRPADVYALMGNALDNALERTAKEPEGHRIISLQIRRRGEMVVIHLENQCSSSVEFRDGLPVTDKEDKNFHGFGVKSIRYLAEKYGGQVLMRTHDGIFLLDVLLPQAPSPA